MSESTSPMHQGAQGDAFAEQRVCDYCGAPVVSRKAWARFCSGACRSKYHTAEGRAKAIAEAAPRMFEALQQIARGVESPVAIATAAIHDLKAPEAIPALKAAADSLADTIEKVNRDADRREVIAVGPGAIPT